MKIETDTLFRPILPGRQYPSERNVMQPFQQRYARMKTYIEGRSSTEAILVWTVTLCIVTLSSAEQVTSFDIYHPNFQLANSENILHYW